MEAGLEESDIIGDFSMGSKPDVEGNSVSKVFEPFLYFKLKPEACEGHGSDDHVIFTGEDGVATHTDVPAVNIFYPPPKIVIIDCIGDVHVRDLQKLQLKTSVNFVVDLAVVSSVCTLADAEPVWFCLLT